jgi:hypothetical protein
VETILVRCLLPSQAQQEACDRVKGTRWMVGERGVELGRGRVLGHEGPHSCGVMGVQSQHNTASTDMFE